MKTHKFTRVCFKLFITIIIGFLTLNSSFINIFGETNNPEYWVIIEEDTTYLNGRTSLTYITAAQKFEITEENANITEISTYLTYIDNAKDGETPHGTVSIFTDDNGVPGIPLGSCILEDKFGPLDLGVEIGPGWINSTFPEPIMVTQGFYWVVLNDTSDQSYGSWTWFTQNDQTNGDTGDWAAKSEHGGSWILNPIPPGDMLLKVKLVQTDPSTPESPPQEEENKTFTFIFTTPNGKRSYNITITIENCSTVIINNRMTIFRANKHFTLESARIIVIHVQNATTGFKSDPSDKFLYGLMMSKIQQYMNKFYFKTHPCASLKFFLRIQMHNSMGSYSHISIVKLWWVHKTSGHK